jgi:reactive intermediate/imine deaminase
MKQHTRTVINSSQAPEAIGTYSQAVKVGDTVYISGQIPLLTSGTLVEGDFEDEICQVFKNLQAICKAADGTLDNIVKLNIYLTDLSHFATVNRIMARYFNQPYPARAALGVASLPKNARVEMDAIMVLHQHIEDKKREL